MTNQNSRAGWRARYALRILVSAALFLLPILSFAAALQIGTSASLLLNNSGGITRINFPDGLTYAPPQPIPCATLETPAGALAPVRAAASSDALRLAFPDGSSLKLDLTVGSGFTLFRLAELNLKSSATSLRLFRIPVPPAAQMEGTLNAAFYQGDSLALMSATPEIIIPGSDGHARSADLAGVIHTFLQSTHAKSGKHSARFQAKSTTTTAGWAMQGRSLQQNLKIKDVLGITAWVDGDAGGEQLKFQLIDEKGGARDYYLPIRFSGWREVSLTSHSLDITTGENLAGLNLYYNSMPPRRSVTCFIDDIQAIVRGENGTTTTVPLEDFEDANAPWWTADHPLLQLEWDFKYAGAGDAIGVIACSRDQLFPTIQQFEKAAGILVPHPDGAWNKQSPAIQESYLFLTRFSEDQFDEALALAQRGGFKHVLLLQNSWCKSTGHYEVNRRNFPDGLPGLVRTVNRFREHGIDVGLHLLGASIDSDDPYITPVPDSRLFKDAQTSLTSAIDLRTSTITVAAMPAGFPAEDGGYRGDGTVLQIGDELIRYASRTTTAPYTFAGCTRGYLGTKVAAHLPGDTVYHLARSYGYHMFDMDTSLLDEVTSNFAAVANACDIDMIYLDGSERLQGPHGRYNARLINAYVSKLKNPDIIVQASSFSHFSWHQLARSASADGHGDLKGYLEQRAINFDGFKRKGMPLDIGWYYGYDPTATPDMYEYILGATIGYGASFSYQVSVDAANAHPFTSQVLDLVRRYERLRLSGRVSPPMKQMLRVAKPLLGRAPEDESRPTEQRRDYRLLKDRGQDVFQRVIYGAWHEFDGAADLASTVSANWDEHLTTGPAAVGMQLHVFASNPKAKTAGKTAAPSATSTAPLALRNPQLTIGHHTLRYNGDIRGGQYLYLWPGEAPVVYGPTAAEMTTGSVVTPSFELLPGNYKIGFTAEREKSDSNKAALHWRARAVFVAPERHVIPPK